jgi:hypothetical protein
MPEFRKKPVVIEARQFTRNNLPEVAEWCGGERHRPAVMETDGWTLDDPVLHIPTLEGTMTASPGDWIIRGVQGEFYPCDPDIFAATYEEVGDGEGHGPVR